MRRKVRWSSQRSSKPKSRMRLWLVGVLIFLIVLTQGFAYVDRNLKPPIMHLAKIRVKQIATEAINEAITSQVTKGQDFEQLVNWKMDSEGKVSGFMLNYAEHMRITSNTFKVVQDTLNNVDQLSEHIPVGMALGSPILASFGPAVPVRIEPQGAAKVELSTRQRDAGINMMLVEVYIHVSVDVAVVIPFDMEHEVVDTEIPISYLLVVGDVPMYYYNSKGQAVGGNGEDAPNISIPMAEDNTTGETGEKDATTDALEQSDLEQP
ncbi:sporulation protein YunB [Paenibacillus crassostreae]|uniref:Sporulation protein YunB n=1 Tax=Paenibacillus crassostreae TaxID=1763538 RepID=A0A167CT08_9BACL|nr:sporulation protein YunB [Paenibacillus crassostreae]AOZ93524.1 sporulation protein YunB [Paenibacillus crassostreae]OAB73546.1 sporulation protein YunB [Paenibacillus crassostreae]